MMTTKPATTPDRKALARELAAEIGTEARYLGAPSFAYRVGPYTINKDASIEGEDLETIHAFLIRHDYIHQVPAVPQPAEEDPAHAEEPSTHVEEAVASAEETSTPSEETATESITETDVSAPISELTASGMVNLLKLVYAKQKLIGAMTQSKFLFMDEEVIDLLNDEKPTSMEAISEMVAGEIQAGMIRGLDMKENMFTFTFPFDHNNSANWKSRAKLLTALIDRAKTAQRINTKRIDPAESELKYYCNSLLMQLGFSSPDFKADRAVLLGHLPGYAAFKSADEMKAFTERRRTAREAVNAEENAPADLEASGEVGE